MKKIITYPFRLTLAAMLLIAKYRREDFPGGYYSSWTKDCWCLSNKLFEGIDAK